MKGKTKRWISVAHFVQTTPDSICSGIHGHNWKIIVEIESPLLNGSGMVLDKHDIDNIIDQLDHKLIVPNNLIESQEDEYCNIINNDKIELEKIRCLHDYEPVKLNKFLKNSLHKNDYQKIKNNLKS